MLAGGMGVRLLQRRGRDARARPLPPRRRGVLHWCSPPTPPPLCHSSHPPQATRKTARQAKKDANFPMRRYAVRA